jgi:hypothetical protein
MILARWRFMPAFRRYGVATWQEQALEAESAMRLRFAKRTDKAHGGRIQEG